MKKTFLALAFCSIVFACNSGDDKPKDAVDTTASKPAAPKVLPENMPGLAMIAADNCLTCHKVEEQSTGPAYRAIANKYEATPANIDSLAIKIIKGGSGVWGQVPMTPHPNLSMDSAREMVKYVMALKNQ